MANQYQSVSNSADNDSLTKHAIVLAVLLGSLRSHHRAEVVVLYRLLIPEPTFLETRGKYDTKSSAVNLTTT